MQEESKISKVGEFFGSLFNRIVNLIVFLIILALVGVIVWFWHENSLEKNKNENLQRDIEKLEKNMQDEKAVRSKLEKTEKVEKPSSNESPDLNSNVKNDLICPAIARMCKNGSPAKKMSNSCDLICPEDEKSQNQNTQNSNCAKEGENFSSVYKNKYKENCCAGLTEWESGMDTRISVADKCFETGMLAGNPVGTCINCGDGVCFKNESICNCPKDCKAENSKFKTVKEFCLNEYYLKMVCKYRPDLVPETKKLCDSCCSSFGMCLD